MLLQPFQLGSPEMFRFLCRLQEEAAAFGLTAVTVQPSLANNSYESSKETFADLHKASLFSIF